MNTADKLDELAGETINKAQSAALSAMAGLLREGTRKAAQPVAPKQPGVVLCEVRPSHRESAGTIYVAEEGVDKWLLVEIRGGIGEPARVPVAVLFSAREREGGAE